MIGEDPGGVGGINQLKNHLQVEGEQQQQQNGAHHVESELTEVKKDGSEVAATDESGAGKNSAAAGMPAQVAEAAAGSAVIDSDSAAAAAADATEEDAGDPIDMSFPKGGGWKQIIIYLFSFPIMFPLFITLPDTKNPNSECDAPPPPSLGH